MTRNQEVAATRAIAIQATLAGVATDGAVKARRIDLRRKPGQPVGRHRIVFFLNGNRCTRKDAARFLTA